MRVLAIIPARGGSKGVVDKNIRPLAGTPLIAYTIGPALASGLLDRVVVSTDSPRIADIARDRGAEVPFMRPAELADDHVPDKPVITHALQWLEAEQGYSCDAVLYLRPTTPLRAVEDIAAAIQILEEAEDVDSVRSMTRVEGVHHPYWMFTRDARGLAQPAVAGIRIQDYYQRQLLPPVYRLNGVVDGVRTTTLRDGSDLWGERMAIVEVPEARAYDIDTEEDFAYLTYLLERNHD